MNEKANGKAKRKGKRKKQEHRNIMKKNLFQGLQRTQQESNESSRTECTSSRKTVQILTYTKRNITNEYLLRFLKKKWKERKENISSQDLTTPRTAICHRHRDIINFI